jgi:hypothetical protein
MRTSIRSLVATLVVATMFVLASAGSAAAKSYVPFKVTLTGQAITTSPTTVEVSGSGNASHLGLVTNVGHIEAHPEVPSDTCTGFLSLHWETLTAANGDELQIFSTDTACFVGPAQLRGTGHWVVEPGGTGRFANASGSGDFSGYADLGAQTIELTLVGSISY